MGSDALGHTPLFIEEEISRNCRQLVIGTGTGALPIMEDVERRFGFRHNGGRAVRRTNDTHRFQALLKRAANGHHRSHDLRHTAATLLSIQKVSTRARSKRRWTGRAPRC